MKHFFSLIILFLLICFTRAYSDVNTTKPRVMLVKDFPPYYFEESGVVKGFAVDYIKGLGKFTNLEFEYVVYDNWSDAQNDLKNNNFDIVPSLGFTSERNKSYHFSNPYESFHLAIFTRAHYNGGDNLDFYMDKRAGVMSRNVGVKYAKKMGIENLTYYKDVQSLLFGLLSNEVDYVVIPEPVFKKRAVKLNVDDKIRVAVDHLMEVKRSLAIVRPNHGLANHLFPLIDEFGRSNEYRDIYLKWFSNQNEESKYREKFYALAISFAVLTFFMLVIFVAVRVRDANKYTASLQSKVDELTITKSKLNNLNQNLENVVVEKTKEIFEGQERYELVVEASNTGIWDWDLTNNQVYFSSMWKKILGYADYEIENDFEEFAIRLHPSEKDNLLAEIDRFIKNPSGNFNKIFRMLSKDGSYKWIMNRSSYTTDKNGNIKSMYGSHLDVTELKNYEEKLALTNKTLETILNAFPEVLYVSDPETYEVIFANKKFVEILGEDPVGQKCFKAIQSFDEPCDFCTNDIILNNEEPYIWEYYNKNLDTHFYVNDQLIEWVDGKKMRFEIAININKLKETENKLKASIKEIEDFNTNLDSLVKIRTKRLEEVNKELESFAYTVSHDLRAPVRHINGFANMLEGELGKEISEKSGHCIDAIKASSEKMNTLIDDLLKFSRLNQVDLQLSKIDPKAIVEKIIDEFAPDYDDRDIDFNLYIHNEIYADKGLMRVVFMNLISNAIKFTQSKDKAVIEVYVHSTIGQDIIEVRDNGLGFDMKYIDRIFGVFETLDKDYSGTGIGLATVKRIILRHGGYIEAESTPGEGAQFNIYLPKAEDDYA